MLTIKDLMISYPAKGNPTFCMQIDKLQMPKGTFTCLTGSNGSGKSSLLNAICNIIPSHITAHKQGCISFDERDLTDVPLNEMFRFLGYQMSEVSRQFMLPESMDELHFALQNMGLSTSEIAKRCDAAIERFDLSDVLSQEASLLSMGQQKLLLFAIVDTLDAEIILLDEPASGLSNASFAIVSKWIMDMKKNGKLVLAADHDVRIIAMADAVYNMDSYVLRR